MKSRAVQTASPYFEVERKLLQPPVPLAWVVSEFHRLLWAPGSLDSGLVYQRLACFSQSGLPEALSLKTLKNRHKNLIFLLTYSLQPTEWITQNDTYRQTWDGLLFSAQCPWESLKLHRGSAAPSADHSSPAGGCPYHLGGEEQPKQMWAQRLDTDF